MRRPAKSRLFVMPNPGPQDPDSPELPLESGPLRCVQVPFDFDSLLDVDDGENAHCPESDGRSSWSPVGGSSFRLWMESQKLR